jgi:predicted dehydrogenase
MKLGIAGNGGIVQMALHILKETDIEVTALWCRNGEKGKPLCEEYGLKQYTDYGAFLKDESFDTVYIGLINSLHYAYAKQAVLAHKHVIVEKPFTSRYAEAVDLIETAENEGVMLFEAIMSRYSKNYDMIISHLEEVGDLKLIQANYSQYSRRYDAYLEGKVLPAFDPALSGGALYDINVYNVHFVTGLFGAPVSVHYYANKGFNGIDTSGTLILQYSGFQAVLTGAKDSASASGTVLQGTKGYLELPERPGVIRNVTLHRNGIEEPEVLDLAYEPSPMKTEFERIAEVIDQKDENQAAVWMVHTRQAMSVLDQARVSADIEFAADTEPIDFDPE